MINFVWIERLCSLFVFLSLSALLIPLFPPPPSHHTRDPGEAVTYKAFFSSSADFFSVSFSSAFFFLVLFLSLWLLLSFLFCLLFLALIVSQPLSMKTPLRSYRSAASWIQKTKATHFCTRHTNRKRAWKNSRNWAKTKGSQDPHPDKSQTRIGGKEIRQKLRASSTSTSTTCCRSTCSSPSTRSRGRGRGSSRSSWQMKTRRKWGTNGKRQWELNNPKNDTRRRKQQLLGQLRKRQKKQQL